MVYLLLEFGTMSVTIITPSDILWHPVMTPSGVSGRSGTVTGTEWIQVVSDTAVGSSLTSLPLTAYFLQTKSKNLA